MDNNHLKTGDVVRHKTLDQLMTVSNVIGDQVSTDFFDHQSKLIKWIGTISEVRLERVLKSQSNRQPRLPMLIKLN